MRKFLALVLTSLIAPLPAGAQDDAWTVLEDVGRGTRVKLSLASGGDVTGTVVEVRDDAVSLRDIDMQGHLVTFSGPNGPEGEKVIARVGVVRVRVVGKGMRYEAAPGQRPEAPGARRVATALGVGRKVDVRTTRPQKLRGTITGIDHDTLTVSHGGSRTTAIPFGEVTQLERAGLHWGAKTAIGVGVTYGALWVIALISMANGTWEF
jgi:hypothetical protein